jgi:peptide/nickel transport system substrate-binding protein
MMIKYLMLGAAAAFTLAPAAMAERGSDGEVKIIYWQAPSILNPYLSAKGFTHLLGHHRKRLR